MRPGTHALMGSSRETLDPDDVSGLLQWVRPSAANLTKDGSNRVSQENDLSGNALHYTNSGGAATWPVWVSGGFGTRDCLRFTRANVQYLECVYNALLSPAAITVILVVKPTGSFPAGGFTGYLTRTSSGSWADGYGIVNGAGPGSADTARAFLKAYNSNFATFGAFTLDAGLVLSFRYNGSRISARVLGVETGLASYSGGFGYTGTPTLYQGFAPSGAYANGDYGDIVIYDNSLSDATLLKVERGLGDYYGIAVT